MFLEINGDLFISDLHLFHFSIFVHFGLSDALASSAQLSIVPLPTPSFASLRVLLWLGVLVGLHKFVSCVYVGVERDDKLRHVLQSVPIVRNLWRKNVVIDIDMVAFVEALSTDPVVCNVKVAVCRDLHDM